MKRRVQVHGSGLRVRSRDDELRDRAMAAWKYPHQIGLPFRETVESHGLLSRNIRHGGHRSICLWRHHLDIHAVVERLAAGIAYSYENRTHGSEGPLSNGGEEAKLSG